MTTHTEIQTDKFAATFRAVASNVGRVIQGKPAAIERLLLCAVAGGHLLLEDVPGVGKTSLVKAFATSIDVSFGRIQFTPDLLPSDVVGTTVWNRSTGEFEFRPGPIFASIVLGDEINRASPKTQSALLEAMAEQQVTVDGSTYMLARPFMVIATQNPIEHEGTYPLPESQMDRFLMRISMGYPDRESELEVLDAHLSGDRLADLGPVATGDDLLEMSLMANAVMVSPAVKSYLVDLAAATRRHPDLTLGMSPRATLSLQRVAQARAAAAGRAFVVPDDVKALAESALAHRLVLTPEAQLHGKTTIQVLADVLRSVRVPTAAGA